MEYQDHYKSFSFESTALYKDKSSKFYAYAFPVDSVEEVNIHLKYLKKEHPKARHFCYAFIIGIAKDQFRANDDGEPSGTAGKPIYGQLEKNDLTNALVVVVRYFGGTKLGVPGLIKAYKSAASLAIESNNIEDKYVTDRLVISCDYEKIGKVQNVISKINLPIKKIDYDMNVIIETEVRQSLSATTIATMKSILLERSLEDINSKTKVDGIEFEIT